MLSFLTSANGRWSICLIIFFGISGVSDDDGDGDNDTGLLLGLPLILCLTSWFSAQWLQYVNNILYLQKNVIIYSN